MHGSKYDDIANLSFANKVLIPFFFLFFDEAVKKQEATSALAAVAEDKNAAVVFTPPLHRILLYLLHFLWLCRDDRPGTGED